ncbi:MAG: DnaJ domain-containing protein [Fimbriimonadaceae bacterium]|nr:DnaJ domain-containing protein [Chitinophagales bacterium]
MLKGVSGIWLGLFAGCILDMQWKSINTGPKKIDQRVNNLMLSAYVVQMSSVLNAISYNELKKRLDSFFPEEFIDIRFTFFNELLHQRIQVDAICKQINLYVVQEEKINLLKFLISLSESSAQQANRTKAIYYIANKLNIDEDVFQLNFKSYSNTHSHQQKEKQYYTILNVSQNITYAELRKAYYKLAKQYHPDMNNGSPQNQKMLNEKFRLVTEAYEKIKETKGWK